MKTSFKAGLIKKHRRAASAIDPQTLSLTELCRMVISMACSYDDVAEQIEDKAYVECENGKFGPATQHIISCAHFLESIENKSEEIARDLADIYILLGEMHMCAAKYAKSIGWFEKAIAVDDSYDLPYHSLASAYIHLRKPDMAIKCWEQEIRVAPGNYFSYLLLADIFEKKGNHAAFVEVLERLLERNPDNIRALHRLIRHHEKFSPGLDVSLLRRRLLGADSLRVKSEMVIWTYHMCREHRHEEALWFLVKRMEEQPNLSITWLLAAYVYGKLRQYTKKRKALSEFKRLCHGSFDMISAKLEELGHVFGNGEVQRITRRLAFTRLVSR